MSDYIHIPSSDFPSDILKWMKIKANPKMLLKLMKCCKYFQHFPEFPFFVVKEAFYDGDPRPSSFTTLNDEMYLMEEEYIKNNDKKIWVTNDFGIYDPKLVFSTILPKYAVFDIRFLVLYHQKLSFEELKILTASGTIEKMNFEDTIFKSENGKQVFIDSILECVPNLASLRYANSNIPIIPCNFSRIFHKIDTSKLKSITLDICSYSHFSLFKIFMKKNPHIKYVLYFDVDSSLTSEERKNLQIFVQETLDAGVTEYPPIYIQYPYQNADQYYALNALVSEYYEQKRPYEQCVIPSRRLW